MGMNKKKERKKGVSLNVANSLEQQVVSRNEPNSLLYIYPLRIQENEYKRVIIIMVTTC